MAQRKAGKKSAETFTKEEREAMRERARELKAEARRSASRADGERDLQEKIAEMPRADRALAKRIHELVTKSAPALLPKTWYGMPAYANDDGKVVCFFQSADKFKSRYATFGFNAEARLDEGSMWATSFAVTKLTAADEKKLIALVKQAAA